MPSPPCTDGVAVAPWELGAQATCRGQCWASLRRPRAVRTASRVQPGPGPPGLWDPHHRESRGRLPGPLPGCLGRGPALPQSPLFFRPLCLAQPLVCGGQAHPLHRGQQAGPRPREGGELTDTIATERLSKPGVRPWNRPQQGPPTFLPSPALSSDFSGLPRRGVGAATPLPSQTHGHTKC